MTRAPEGFEQQWSVALARTITAAEQKLSLPRFMLLHTTACMLCFYRLFLEGATQC